MKGREAPTGQLRSAREARRVRVLSFIVSLEVVESVRFMFDWLFMEPLDDAPWLDIPVELDEPDVVALEVFDEGVGLAFDVAGIVEFGDVVEAEPVFDVPVPGDAPLELCATERLAPRASEAAAASVRMGDSFLMMSFPVAR